MMEFEAKKIAEKIEQTGITHEDLDTLCNDLKINSIPPNTEKDENNGKYKVSKKRRIAHILHCENDEKVKQFLQIIKKYCPNIELPNEYQKNNITNDKHFENQNLQQRYEELIKAINNNMSLSFFWLAGSIIEEVLCEYCKKNNIKSNKDDIDGYITALYPDEKNKKNDEKNSKLPQSNAIKHILNIYRNYRNTIHPDNVNNDFINNKNLQNRKEELDDVIKYFQ